MTMDQFDMACRGFCKRRPFRAFLIEFSSGFQHLVSHPEAVGQKSGLYSIRCPDGGYVVFAAENVVRLLDVAAAKES